MSVADLIAALQGMPQDAEVSVSIKTGDAFLIAPAVSTNYTLEVSWHKNGSMALIAGRIE